MSGSSGENQVYLLVVTAPFSTQGWDENGNPITVNWTVGQTYNRIVWDGVTPYTPPPNTELQLAPDQPEQ